MQNLRRNIVQPLLLPISVAIFAAATWQLVDSLGERAPTFLFIFLSLFGLSSPLIASRCSPHELTSLLCAVFLAFVFAIWHFGHAQSRAQEANGIYAFAGCLFGLIALMILCICRIVGYLAYRSANRGLLEVSKRSSPKSHLIIFALSVVAYLAVIVHIFFMRVHAG